MSSKSRPGLLPMAGLRRWETDPQRLPRLLDMLAIVIESKGSVFPRAFCFSLPCALWAVVMKMFDENNLLGSLAGLQILSDAAAYSGFSLVIGFLFVFRTNMAYNRHWEGIGAAKRMFAEWFDAASTIIAFSKASKASPEETADFLNQFVQHLSLLHGAAMATLRSDEHLDLASLDCLEDESILALQDADFPVTVIFQWIQQLLVKHLETGVLSVPAPIVSRAFQEFANGMVAFHDAQRVQTTSFPFPYVQMTTLLLLVHWFVTPFVICMWTQWISWVFIFTLVQVFIFWCLYFTAFEIEFPFKKGHNNYAAEEAHAEFVLELQVMLSTMPAKVRSSEMIASFDATSARSSAATAHTLSEERIQRITKKQPRVSTSWKRKEVRMQLEARLSAAPEGPTIVEVGVAETFPDKTSQAGQTMYGRLLTPDAEFRALRPPLAVLREGAALSMEDSELHRGAGTAHTITDFPDEASPSRILLSPRRVPSRSNDNSSSPREHGATQGARASAHLPTASVQSPVLEPGEVSLRFMLV